MRIFRRAYIPLALIAAFLAGSAHAASFDCRKAATRTEKMICSDKELGNADSEMSGLYHELTSGTYQRKDLLTDQRVWLKNVRDACDDLACMRSVHRERIAYLKTLLAPQQASCTLPKPPAAAGCEQTLACVENADHSFFQAVGNICAKGNKFDYSVDIYRHADKSAAPVLAGREAGLDGLKQVNWNAIDRNGYAELSVTTACGAGPNCSAQLMHYDPDTQKMYDYYSAAGMGIDYFDGYLLEHGSGGYVESEIAVHKMHTQGKRDIVDDKAFIIAFYGAPDGPQTCAYFEYIDDGGKTRPVTPPNDKWYKRFCPKSGKL